MAIIPVYRGILMRWEKTKWRKCKYNDL